MTTNNIEWTEAQYSILNTIRRTADGSVAITRGDKEVATCFGMEEEMFEEALARGQNFTSSGSAFSLMEDHG